MNACIGKLKRIDIRKNILANIFLKFNKKKRENTNICIYQCATYMQE